MDLQHLPIAILAYNVHATEQSNIEKKGKEVSNKGEIDNPAL